MKTLTNNGNSQHFSAIKLSSIAKILPFPYSNKLISTPNSKVSKRLSFSCIQKPGGTIDSKGSINGLIICDSPAKRSINGQAKESPYSFIKNSMPRLQNLIRDKYLQKSLFTKKKSYDTSLCSPHEKKEKKMESLNSPMGKKTGSHRSLFFNRKNYSTQLSSPNILNQLEECTRNIEGIDKATMRKDRMKSIYQGMLTLVGETNAKTFYKTFFHGKNKGATFINFDAIDSDRVGRNV